MNTKDKVRLIIEELVSFNKSYEPGEIWKPVMNTKFIDTSVSQIMKVIGEEKAKSKYHANEMSRKMENYKL